MSLSAGTRLGAYEILAAIGSGGMGEVYRAADTTLGREVAIKVLPDVFAADPERVGRLRIEAKALAALNHPHIATLFGMEVVGEQPFLVMELVTGDTLADRLMRGPLPLSDTLRFAIQIADALEAAHEKGIVHRDLKPANVKVASDDRVKVLDFGLARLGAADSSPSAAGLTQSPTLSLMATQAGVILGTAAYMSPEQAKGLVADHRSDIFSFGVVLYELLTRRQAFQGETTSDTLASVLAREPDLAALPPQLHPRLVELIKRCLEKNPRKRWQAIGDVRLELESLAAAPYHSDTQTSATVLRPPLWKRVLPVAAAIAMTAAATTWVNRRLSPSLPADIVRFSFPAQELRASPPTLAISPDGTRIVYIAAMPGVDRVQLMLRNLSDADTRPISGTMTLGMIQSPVFSPDGRFVAYFSIMDRTLKKIAVSGGTAVTLCTLPSLPAGAISWRGEAIVVAQPTGIVKIPANGGDPQLAVRNDPGSVMSSPQIVDDRGSIVFALSADFGTSNRWDAAQIVLQTPDGSRHVLVAGADPHYLPTGHLVYALGGSLVAVPFDPLQARIVGSPAPVIEGVARSSNGAAAQAAIAGGGTLAYVPGPATASSARTLGLIDLRNGKVQPLPFPPNAYTQPRVSPDGHFVVVATDDGREGTIWICDLVDQGPPRRLTFGGRNVAPIWTPDGRFVTYQSDQQGGQGLFLQRADGTGPIERLTKADAGTQHYAESWSPDGKILAFRVAARTNSIWAVARGGDRTPKPLLEMKDRSQVLGEFSPDGRWIAYGSNELDGLGYQVFVQPFPPDGTTKFQAESRIGSAPLWSRDGKRLFFSYTTQVFAMDVRTSPTFATGQPVEIAGTGGSLTSLAAVRNYDLMSDGNQLLVVLREAANERGAADRGYQISVALNWLEELKARVPVK